MIELLDLKTSILDEKVKEALIEQRLSSFLKFGAIKSQHHYKQTSPHHEIKSAQATIDALQSKSHFVN